MYELNFIVSLTLGRRVYKILKIITTLLLNLLLYKEKNVVVVAFYVLNYATGSNAFSNSTKSGSRGKFIDI